MVSLSTPLLADQSFMLILGLLHSWESNMRQHHMFIHLAIKRRWKYMNATSQVFLFSNKKYLMLHVCKSSSPCKFIRELYSMCCFGIYQWLFISQKRTKQEYFGVAFIYLNFISLSCGLLKHHLAHLTWPEIMFSCYQCFDLNLLPYANCMKWKQQMLKKNFI